jgi:hypothetical protein
LTSTCYQHLLEPADVTDDGRQAVGQRRRQDRLLLAQAMGRKIDRTLNGFGDLERHGVVAGAGAAHEGPEVADDARRALDLVADAFHLCRHETGIDGTAALDGVGELVLGRVAGEVDHLQWLAELVGNRGRHFADSGEPFGGEQGLLGLAPLGVVDAQEGDLAHRPR